MRISSRPIRVGDGTNLSRVRRRLEKAPSPDTLPKGEGYVCFLFPTLYSLLPVPYSLIGESFTQHPCRRGRKQLRDRLAGKV